MRHIHVGRERTTLGLGEMFWRRKESREWQERELRRRSRVGRRGGGEEEEKHIRPIPVHFLFIQVIVQAEREQDTETYCCTSHVLQTDVTVF